jgi:glycosyltransferase involved in cell wall biosynthesis
VLVAALGRIRHLPWRLVIAGDRGRHPATAARLAADIAALGLTDRIELRGALLEDALGALYAASDLFVLPSHHEGYGMAYAEAMVHGLPVIGTTAGAIPETVPPQAGVLVPPDDVAALAAALRELIESAPERERLAAGARAARFPTWPEQARLFARVLDDLP